MTRRSKVAARLIQKLPEVVQPLRDGRLCPTGIVALAKELTVENPLAILLRFFHLSRREAAEVSAAIRLVEQPPLRDVVTAPPVTSKSPRCDMNVAFHVVENHPTWATSRLPPPTAPTQVVPLTEDLRRLHVTCLEAVHRQSRRRAEGSGARPTGSLGREGHRRRARPPAGTAGNTPGRRQGATEGLPPDGVRPYPRRGAAGGVFPRRREVPVAARFRRQRVQIDLSRSQSARRAPGSRRRMDGQSHRE